MVYYFLCQSVRPNYPHCNSHGPRSCTMDIVFFMCMGYWRWSGDDASLQVDEGKAKEGLISVGSTQREEPDPLDPDIIQRFDNKFSYRDIPENYYMDEDGDEVRRCRSMAIHTLPPPARCLLYCALVSPILVVSDDGVLSKFGCFSTFDSVVRPRLRCLVERLFSFG